MHIPPVFREDSITALIKMMREVKLSTFITATAEGLIATPLPLFLDPNEGEFGTLYGHLARVNPQWKQTPSLQALVVFSGPDAYITPSWYASKAEHGKVVPTWDYQVIHVYGEVEFFDDQERLREVVTRLTDLHETPREQPWQVQDAPERFIDAQLRGIIGLKLPISRIEGACKMSQNRSNADRQGVVTGLRQSDRPEDHRVADKIPTGEP